MAVKLINEAILEPQPLSATRDLCGDLPERKDQPKEARLAKIAKGWSLLLLVFLLAACDSIEKRALILEGDLSLNGLITDIEADGGGCYVGTSAENPEGCIIYTGETCNVTIGVCP